MSTTNLGIDQVFPNYTLDATAATKAAITDVIDTAGANDGDAFTVTALGVTTTITLVSTLGSPAANNIQIQWASSGTDAESRNRIRIAINGTEDANVVYGTGTDSADGVDGLKAINGTSNTEVSLEAEDAGANTISAAGTPLVGVPLSNTGVEEGGSAVIPLSDLGYVGNDLTNAEAAGASGDFRKLAFHFIRAYQTYFDAQESVASVTISDGGAGYTVGDVLNFSGGGAVLDASGTVTAVNAGVITGISAFTAGTTGGHGYNTIPTVSVTAQGTVTTTAALAAVLTANLPSRLTTGRGSLSENTNTGILSRTYSLTFGFDEDGLELADD